MVSSTVTRQETDVRVSVARAAASDVYQLVLHDKGCRGVMVIMDYRDLLTEVSIFLRVTLAGEKLSDHAELCRQQLIKRLITREGSPAQAYIDMNGSTNCQKIQHQNSDCYEEFDSAFESYKSKSQSPEGYDNNLYNNLTAVNKENNYANDETDAGNYVNLRHQHEDNMYINPSSPLANTPVSSKPSLPLKNPSNSNSERNSFISLKKDSDRASDTSSYTSNSTREESAEVVALSASALRYAASKCGVLGRREKFLFVDHTKQYWVAVVQQNLVMYSTDKDNKPLAVIDIRGYQARPVAVANNKTDYKFELVAPGKKTFQFIAEKQLDMDKWIGAINVAAKMEEAIRQLPTPPPAVAALETYDQPDSVIRQVILEAEYELPDVLLRNHTASNSWRNTSVGGDVSRRNSEPRQLPSPPQQTYDSPEPGVRPVEMYECLQEELYHCIEDQPETQLQKPKKPLRRLPSLPQEEEEMYDQPEPKIRPVSSIPGAQDETIIQDELYSVIENHSRPVIQEAVYKNTEENCHIQDEDNNYYNLMPSYPEKETEQECIYNVITEQRPKPSPSPDNEPKKPPISAKPVFINSQMDRGKLKREEKKLSPFVSNMATIFNKSSSKPQLREVKPPIIGKTSQ